MLQLSIFTCNNEQVSNVIRQIFSCNSLKLR